MAWMRDSLLGLLILLWPAHLGLTAMHPAGACGTRGARPVPAIRMPAR
jgi:hypothetical protein